MTGDDFTQNVCLLREPLDLREFYRSVQRTSQHNNCDKKFRNERVTSSIMLEMQLPVSMDSASWG